MPRPYVGIGASAPYSPTNTILREVAVVRSDTTRNTVNEEQVRLPDGTGKIARLTCTCSQFQRRLEGPWCKHVEDVLNREYDGRPRHSDGHRTKVELPPHIEVPIFARPWLAVPCVLSRSPDITNADSVSVNGEHIGFVFIGQGRKSVRGLVIDWLVEKSVHLPSCPADHHYTRLPWEGYGSDDPVGFDPRNKFHLTNLADLILTGQCRRCNEDNGVPDL